MARLHPLTPDDLTAEQEEVRQYIRSSRTDPSAVENPDGSLRGPFAAMVQGPTLGRRVADLGHAVRYGSSLDPRLLELAIVTVGVHWNSDFEVWAHSRLARAAGVQAVELDTLLAGGTPMFERADEHGVYTAVSELLRTSRIGATSWAGLAFLSAEQQADLVHTVGYYCLISLSLNAFEVPLPSGETSPLG